MKKEMIYLACMFTGIIETMGIVKEVTPGGGNKIFWIESELSPQFQVDQSISHNGACLTIEEIRGSRHRVTAIDETLQITNLHNWHPGTLVNLERSLLLKDRLDGHFVQGHIDIIAACLKKEQKNGSWVFRFDLPKKFAELVTEKGSICINGVSLTAFNVKKKSFCVAIIPFTLEHTNMKELKEGDFVNIEFDILGKYILRSKKINAF